MPLGAARITLLAFSPTTVVVEATVIRRKVGISAVGGASIDTTYSKFGGSSFESTTSNYAYGLTDQDFTTSSDWTYEFWFRPSASVSGHTAGLSADSYLAGLSFYQNGTNMVVYTGGNAGGWRYNTGNQSGLTVGVWSHLAVVQSGTNWKFFIDGVEKVSATPGGTMNPPSLITLGGVKNSGSIEYEQGNIDEVRISDTARYTTGFTPSTTPFVNDDNTTLLLHMDGTDGSTFIEDDNGTGRSPSSVSAQGNAQVDTAYSQFGGASAYLDGTGDYLEIDNDFLFGTTDDFTIEFWYKKHTTNTTEQIASNRGSYNTGHWYIQFDSSTDKIQWGVNGASAQRSSSTYDDTNWHHLAIVRDSSVFELFVDGSSQGTLTGSYTWGLANNTYKFGQVATSHGNISIDEIRISDTPRYTSAFTPSTTPFTNDGNTLLLVHCNGTDTTTVFRDDNGQVRSPVGVTAHGNAQLDTAQSKFGGVSLQLDGNDDYLVIHGADGSFNDEWVNGSEWTVEYWVRGTSFSGYEVHFGDWGSAADRSFFLGSDTGGDIMFFYTDSGGTLDTAIRADSQLSTNTWHHIALVKDSSNFTLYVDGSSVDSGASENLRAQGNPTRIGASATNAEDFLGYIDEVRVSNTARYTGTFTAPTEQFQNDANTLLLLHMDGTDTSTTIIDDNGKIEPGLTYSGDSYASSVKLAVPFDIIHGMDDVSHSLIGSTSTQATLTDGAASSLSTTQVKWTSPSYSNSYLGDIGLGSANTYALSTSIPASGSGTFVVEGWFYANNSTSNANWCLSSGESGGRWLFGINNGSTFQFGNENNIGIGSGWHHLAIVCDSGTKRFYHDGVYKGAWVSSNTGFSTLHVGQFNAGDGNDFRGHIQDLKVTIGSIRGYTGTSTSSANFALPRSIALQYAQPLALGGDISYYNDGTNTYFIHKFTSSGTFTPLESLTVDALLVGAGGGGGASDGGFTCGGGGGGGETSYTSGISATAQGYTITCGTGGSSASNGGDTTALSYTAEGGGYGGGGAGGAASRTDAAGGGGRGHWQNNNMSGGSGTYAGGNGKSSAERGGGGGGNGSAGTAASGSTAGSGGNGVDYSTYFGTDVGASGYFAGGGGGGAISGSGSSGTHGGGSGTTTTGSSATAGTGSGGGGAGGNNNSGGSGSDGVVIIRYAI